MRKQLSLDHLLLKFPNLDVKMKIGCFTNDHEEEFQFYADGDNFKCL